MSLEEKVAAVLESRTVRRINFRCCNIPVYGSGFVKLAGAIRNRHIQVYENTVLAAAGVAMYRYAVGRNAVNVLELPSSDPSSIAEKALIVHEMTHALEDYHRKDLNAINAECAAYVAQGMYLYLASPDRVPLPVDLDEATQDLLLMAYSAGTDIATTRGGYNVSDTAARNIKERIEAHPLYRNKRGSIYSYDGI